MELEVSIVPLAVLYHSRWLMSWQYMFNAINNTPDIYLDELQMELKDVLGVTVDKSMIWCGLRHGGYTMKQVCTRLIYIYISADITPANSCCHWAKCWEMGGICGMCWNIWSWATCICWQECSWPPYNIQRKSMGNTWQQSNSEGILCTWATVSDILCLDFPNMLTYCMHSFSILPALSLTKGILHCDIAESTFDSNLFYTFISWLLDCMEPFPGSNFIIVTDNCCIHKHPAILDLIESQ